MSVNQNVFDECETPWKKKVIILLSISSTNEWNNFGVFSSILSTRVDQNVFDESETPRKKKIIQSYYPAVEYVLINMFPVNLFEQNNFTVLISILSTSVDQNVFNECKTPLKKKMKFF